MRKRIVNVLTSQTGRLASSYLLVMMLVSLGFSLVFYTTSSYQLGRQLPPQDLIQRSSGADAGAQAPSDNHQADGGDLGHFINGRIDQGKVSLQHQLLYLNLGALAISIVLSYILARRTLRPIEHAMDAQVQFVNDASHELRTPLTAIRASNDVALRNPKLSLQAAKSVIAQNSDDVDRLKALADGLLALARNEKTDLLFSTVNLQDIVGEAMTQIVMQASKKNIRVQDEVANVWVLGNQAALQQVLIILLDNAIKYSHKMGNIYLRSHQKGKTVYLAVADEGIGIGPDHLPHLFKRFYRVDQARSDGKQNGYGLGLSIAERIMENHGGSISVASTVGKGTTFTLTLTLA